MSWSLINNLWNYVFALSNLSLFVLLPFSYFFIESQGFKKNKNGIMQRVYETLAVCTLLIVVILCLADIVLALMSSSVSIISITSVNLPLVYSFVSLAGVMLLLLSTPIGFAKMFAIAGEMTVVPDRDDIIINRLEKYYEERTRNANSNMTSNKFWQRNCDPPTFYSPVLHRFSTLRQRPQKIFPAGMNGSGDCDNVCYMLSSSSSISSTPTYRYFPESAECCSTYGNGDCHFLDNQTESNGPFSDMTKWNHVYSQSLFTLYTKTFRLFWQCFRLIKYPASVIILLVLTGISLLMVIINSLKLIFGYRSLPVYAQYMEVHTRHSLGLVGVVVESIIIIYVMATSLIGFYCIPFVRALRPRRAHTSLTVIIINCSLVLILSSALPILANTLGITSFDLLGAYSSLNWLNNFKLVLAYNILFASCTSCIHVMDDSISASKESGILDLGMLYFLIQAVCDCEKFPAHCILVYHLDNSYLP
ncbi:LMBR1-like region [Dictyocaulus viviparus]|uniref:LMBR1-like region n=1 Tax=Dictyocaulus viviparus TaxID=29172 RepID=A0A0D8Y4R4_DICVI|nr:LMBR1-like region [Dictyocaulus viviparus]